MKNHKAVTILVASMLLLASLASAQAPQPTADTPADLREAVVNDRAEASKPAACADALFSSQDLVLQSTEGTSATPTEGTDGKKGSSSLSPSGTEDAFCEWFSISCSNGSSDECCGSVNSCLSYCGEVCGEACIYESDN